MEEKLNLRSQILNSNDIKSEMVTIEEWGVTVEVKSLTSKKRANVLSESMDGKGRMDFEKLYPDLVIASTYDPETHDAVFQMADRDLLNEKSGGALEKIAQVVLRLSGLDKESVGGAEKNS